MSGDVVWKGWAEDQAWSGRRVNVLSLPFPLVVLLGRQKPGKWCAMHVRVAYMILRHQEKMKVLGLEGWGERAGLSPGPLPLAELGRILARNIPSCPQSLPEHFQLALGSLAN